MDAVVGWVLDVSLSEQQTYATLIMFMDIAFGWVLDASLSEQQTCAMLILFMDVAGRWILCKGILPLIIILINDDT
jgi:hypothetical protein